MIFLSDRGFYICLVIGYVFGNFLTAEAVARLFAGKKPDEIGSGNPGMANIMSNVGFWAGVLVLAGDVLKTVLACIISYFVLKTYRIETVILWTGFAAILGHNYPVWKKFKGGKGVAVCCTWVMLVLGVWGVVVNIIAGIVTFITGYLPIGGIMVPLLGMVFALFTRGSSAAFFMFLAFLAMLPKHRKALIGIFDGSEKRKFDSIKKRIGKKEK